MPIPIRFSIPAAAALLLAAAPALGGGIYWGVDVFDTPNLPGFKTYDLTLKTIDGAPSVVSFDSALGGGISGPLNQSARRPGGKSQLFGGGSDPSNLADSRFLFTPGDGHLTIGNLVDSDSLLSMTWGAFNYAIDPTTREMPFARLVTNDPASVRLNGSVHTFQGGGASGGAYPIDFTLDRVFDFTSPPPPPVIPVVPVIPVAYDSPPVVVTPEVPSPVVVTPPVFVAPASPPGPVSGAIYWGVNSFETPGLPGFTTYEVTMKSAAGAILSMAFDPAVGGGISGPLHQAPGDSVIFEGGDDAGNLGDSRFLLTPTEANLVFNSAESANAMQTVFGTYGNRLDPSAVEVPFARFVTDRPNDVLISGNVGTVLPWGGTIQNSINLSLNDMLALTSPLEIPNDPHAPPPPPPIPAQPSVVEPQQPGESQFYQELFFPVEETFEGSPPSSAPGVIVDFSISPEGDLLLQYSNGDTVVQPGGAWSTGMTGSISGVVVSPVGWIGGAIDPDWTRYEISVGTIELATTTSGDELLPVDTTVVDPRIDRWSNGLAVDGAWTLGDDWAWGDLQLDSDAYPVLAIDYAESYGDFVVMYDSLAAVDATDLLLSTNRVVPMSLAGWSPQFVYARGAGAVQSAGVPEPGAATLALVAMAGVRRRGRR
jgi:hypothetical protein